jgi:methionyl aminopeptidase
VTIQRSWSELSRIRNACLVVRDVLDELENVMASGMRTKELDRIARERIIKTGGRPAFLGYRDYPASLCVSVNDEVIHGIPGERRIEDGDIVSLDIGAVVDGYYGDAARTVAVGGVSREAETLIRVTREALWAAIESCRVGKRVGDIGHAIELHALSHGYSTVKEYAGHGIGTSLHEEPQVPNYGPPGRRERLLPGMCLALEPMINIGGSAVHVLKDGWTTVTSDGSLSAHFELTVAVTSEGPWVLEESCPYGDRLVSNA